MMRSMFSGVSGLRSHQTMMDVVGNNISNVNTAGFKASHVSFSESLSQVLRGASGATDERAGINGAEIGLGVKVAQIDSIFTQGASQVTGRATDLAIQGDGFFVVEAANETTYTRLGSFIFDENGTLTSASGGQVQGWVATNGVVDTNSRIQSIRIPLGQVIDPEETTEVAIGGSLSSDALVGDISRTSIEVFDSLGVPHEATYSFTKTNVNEWSVAVEIDGTPATIAPATVTFDASGQLTSASLVNVSGFTPTGALPMDFDVDFGTALALVQFGGAPTMEAKAKNGQAIGYLVGYSISDVGLIEGQFSNGQNNALGQVATASFANPGGLSRAPDSTFRTSVNSGEPLVGLAGTGNRGLMSSGTLEMSNVDLAREFTNLIIAQRGFQANSRVITTADELLSDLVNLKR